MIDERNTSDIQLAEYILGRTVDEIVSKTSSGVTFYYCMSGQRTLFSYALRGEQVVIPNCDEQSSNAIVSVYPNPTTGKFTIVISLSDESSEPVTLQVVNIAGQVVYNGKTMVANGLLLEEIQLSCVSAGKYLVKAIINGKVYSALLSDQKQ